MQYVLYSAHSASEVDHLRILWIQEIHLLVYIQQQQAYYASESFWT